MNIKEYNKIMDKIFSKKKPVYELLIEAVNTVNLKTYGKTKKRANTHNRV